MGIRKAVAGAIFVAFLMTSGVSAAQSIPNMQSTQCVSEEKGFTVKDPVKHLETVKEKLRQRSAEGKISKEKAEEISKKIDAKIKEIKDFDKLSLKQKRSKVTNDFKTLIDKKVQDGKLTSEEANTKINEFNSKVEKWDGSGYPRFYLKGAGSHHKHKQ